MVIYLLAGFFLLLFIVLSFIDRRRISNGIILTMALFFSVLSVVYATFSKGNELLVSVMGTVLLLLVLLIPFFVVGIATMLIVNGRLMLKREGRKLANMLPLIIGLGILALIITWFGSILKTGSPILGIVVVFIVALVGYFSFLFLSFLLSTFLYQFNFPRYNQDFLIVLGSGLIGGDRVPPLLASRLNRAIKFYDKQYAKKGKRATFIVSGGQGANETISEAEAMRGLARINISDLTRPRRISYSVFCFTLINKVIPFSLLFLRSLPRDLVPSFVLSSLTFYFVLSVSYTPL
ncbi:YdcF family protein, partial [Listeria monocytogenes]|uniref:YdcF family protein n=1 Tax=Listeria monocytogenes TaxID=1639 RepID=UPI0021C2F371